MPWARKAAAGQERPLWIEARQRVGEARWRGGEMMASQEMARGTIVEPRLDCLEISGGGH